MLPSNRIGLAALASIFAGLGASLGNAVAHGGMSGGGFNKTATRRVPTSYIDKLGLPHGTSGSKLARKAAMGRLTLNHGIPAPRLTGRLMSERKRASRQHY